MSFRLAGGTEFVLAMFAIQPDHGFSAGSWLEPGEAEFSKIEDAEAAYELLKADNIPCSRRYPAPTPDDVAFSCGRSASYRAVKITANPYSGPLATAWRRGLASRLDCGRKEDEGE